MAVITLAYANAQGVLRGATAAVANVQRSWLLNDCGAASFDIPLAHEAAPYVSTPDAILWLYEDNVPPFVGTVVERSWSDGMLNVQLRSAEQLLRGLITRQGMLFGVDNPVSLGTVAYNLALSGLANVYSPLQLGLCDASAAKFAQYDYADVYEAITTLTKDRAAFFWVDEQLRLNVRDSRGQDLRSSVVLSEGHALADVRVVETFDSVVTAIVGLGKGGDLLSRPKKAMREARIGREHGAVVEYSDAIDEAAVEHRLVNELARTSTPTRTIEATLLPSHSYYRTVALGDIVTIVTNSPLGWTTTECLIVGIERDATDRYRLAFETLVQPSGIAPSKWELV